VLEGRAPVDVQLRHLTRAEPAQQTGDTNFKLAAIIMRFLHTILSLSSLP